VGDLTGKLQEALVDGTDIIHNVRFRSLVDSLGNGVRLVQAPAQRVEHLLHLPVAYLVIPIFALANVGTLIVVWMGGLQVIGGTLTLGELVAFNTYLAMLTFPVMMLGMIMGMITRAGASAERVFEVLDARVEVQEKPDAVVLPPVDGRVEFRDVHFRYVGSDGDVLKGISFVAEPGQTVALLGSTGAGKSSVINLIPRFYDATGGQVLVDGHDLRDVTLESLRSQIGIVLQETNLFSGTIRDEHCFWLPRL